MMNRVTPSLRLLCAICLFAGIAISHAHAQGVVMTNVNFEQTYSVMKITYDLVGEDDSYAVQLMLRKKNDPSYTYAPKGMRGDVGEQVAPGRGKVIEWDLAEDFPTGIDPSSQFALQFEARYAAPGFFQKYTPYLVGAAAVVGATIYFLLSGEDGESAFPDPSGRPGGW